MSRNFAFYGSPLWGGPLPPLAGQSTQTPNKILWQQSSTRVILTDAISHFSKNQQLISSLTIFADEANTASALVGDQNLVSGQGINFELSPGRSATIYTDDWQNEVFDLSKWNCIAALNSAGVLYLTIWSPQVIR